MERLLQEFEKPIVSTSGETYKVYVHGRSRPGDTWQGWLVFERSTDGEKFTGPVETTQSSAEGILYWATGLTDAYFDGALDRAQRAVTVPSAPISHTPQPLIGASSDAATRRDRLAELERAVLACFAQRGVTQLLTQQLFDALPYAHADVVRGLEDLEKQGGLLIRRTEEGNDFLHLTKAGAEAAGIRADARTSVVAGRALPRPR